MTGMRISGLGLVGGFGCGKQDLLRALTGRDVEPQYRDVRGRQVPVYAADSAPLEQYLNKRALRRIDHFSRLALLGAFQALEDAGQPELDRSRLGVVIGSGFGALQTTFKFLDSVLDDGDAFASPTAFSNSVHNAAAAHISMQLKLTGPSLTVSQFDQSLVSGLLAAQHWLAEGRVDAVLLGVVDEFSPVLGYCWGRFLGSADEGRMQPLELSRATAIPGEGAAFFLLQPEAAAGGYATIEQVVMGNLYGSRADLPPGRVALLDADGVPETGTLYRQQLGPEQPVSCYTSLYGASPVAMAFDLAVAALALRRGVLFPAAAEVPENFPGFLVDPQPCSELTCLRYGFDGNYAAISLRQGGV